MAEPPTSVVSISSASVVPPVRVLVADDSRNAAEILAMFFQLEGMETVIALNGVEAVAAAERFEPDLICLDLQMPTMDGYEAARLIRQKMGQVVIVALSGWDGSEERRRVVDAGFDVHLIKPVKPDDLRGVISRFLVQKPGELA